MDYEKLEKLIDDIKEKMSSRDLSDGYLKENGCSTRNEVGIGEYSYGITMIPCSWVIDYLEECLELRKENKKFVEHNNRIKEIDECVTNNDGCMCGFGEPLSIKVPRGYFDND